VAGRVPRVRARLFAEYYDLAGKTREIDLELPEGATVLDLARLLEEKFPGLRGRLVDGDRIQEETRVLVNGRNVEWLEREKTRLSDGDRVAFFPPAAGG
jgi:molybdopterin synthase sulfur carrier subunit